MNMLLMVVPRYGAYAMSLTGLMMLWSTTTYYLLLPRQPLKVRIIVSFAYVKSYFSLGIWQDFDQSLTLYFCSWF